jgi:alpha-beta hydrolase superfamily lysophospholipase
MSDFSAFPHSSPTGATLAVRHVPATITPRAVVQINHGLAEHAARYQRFARFLAARGYHVYVHDHRGHGATRAPDSIPGAFASRDGASKVIADVAAIHALIGERHPGLPVVTFGHSMGGLIALNFAETHPAASAALAVWNSNFNAGLAGRAGQAALRLEAFSRALTRRVPFCPSSPSRHGPMQCPTAAPISTGCRAIRSRSISTWSTR